MEIRKAITADVKGVHSLLENEKNTSWTVGNFNEATRHKDSIFYVAEKDGKIVGYVIGYICPGKKEDCMLAETRVKESERNKNIGKKLVETFCKGAFARGSKSIYTYATEKHIRFYSKTGFKKSKNQWIEMVKTK
ncbi:MAG TPA: GNAT family N-acetyltransferase [archaeon]|nr:GNAT family N-acetyltransferase [archaeon]